MKAIGYIRVSTEEQARKGVSIDNRIKRKLSTPRLKPTVNIRATHSKKLSRMRGSLGERTDKGTVLFLS